jgi:hypothetical protein
MSAVGIVLVATEDYCVLLRTKYNILDFKILAWSETTCATSVFGHRIDVVKAVFL